MHLSKHCFASLTRHLGESADLSRSAKGALETAATNHLHEIIRANNISPAIVEEINIRDFVNASSPPDTSDHVSVHAIRAMINEHYRSTDVTSEAAQYLAYRVGSYLAALVDRAAIVKPSERGRINGEDIRSVLDLYQLDLATQ